MERDLNSGINFSLEIYEDAKVKNGEVVGGRKVKEFKLHNRVPLTGLNLIRDWFYGAGEYRTIKYVAVGSAAYRAPAASDTWLDQAFAYLPLTKVYEDVGRVRITTLIGDSEYNGYYFSESGLVTGTTPTNNVLYARVSHERTVKSIDNTFCYAWECWWSL